MASANAVHKGEHFLRHLTLVAHIAPWPKLPLFTASVLQRTNSPLYHLYEERWADFLQALHEDSARAPRLVTPVLAKTDSGLFKKKIMRQHCRKKVVRGLEKALAEANIDPNGFEIVKARRPVAAHAAAESDGVEATVRGRQRLWGLCTVWVQPAAYEASQADVDTDCRALVYRLTRQLRAPPRMTPTTEDRAARHDGDRGRRWRERSDGTPSERMPAGDRAVWQSGPQTRRWRDRNNNPPEKTPTAGDRPFRRSERQSSRWRERSTDNDRGWKRKPW